MGYQEIPPIPAWLKNHARAEEKWNALWSVLEPTRIKPALHGDMVAEYCLAYSQMRDAAEHLEKSRLVSVNKVVGEKVVRERVMVSPYQDMLDAAMDRMNKAGRQLGLDPQNPFEELRTLEDYEFTLIDDGDGEQDGDAGTGTGGGDGDAGEPTASNDTDASGTVQAGAAGATEILDTGKDH